MTYEEKLYAIFEKIGYKAVLEQALEESGEFIQCAAKHLRIVRGVNYTPVKLADNVNNLQEETADTLLCLDLIITAMGKDRNLTEKRIEEIKAAKLDRWLERLSIEG